MFVSRFVSPHVCGAICFGVILLIVARAQAVVAPSTFTTQIQVQGEEAGTEFDDWAAANIPIATTDALDNPGFVDINTVQIANDDEFIYIRLSFHDNNSLGTFLGFDTDQNVSTGFDVFTLGLVGSDLGYVNDFPFEQEAGVFNTNEGLTGGPIGNGGALIFPFFNIDGPEREIAIPLDVAFTNPDEPAFTGSSFDLLVYSDQGLGDVSEVITYTLATAPVVAGDYNGNGVVDTGDYAIWLQSLGAIGMDLPADGTSDDMSGVPDGDVDLFDYEFWKANIGNGAQAGTSGQGIPEPGAVVLLLVALSGLACDRVRRMRWPH